MNVYVWKVTRSIHDSMLQVSDSQTQLGEIPTNRCSRYLHSNECDMNQSTESLIISLIIKSIKISYHWQTYY